MVVVWLKEARVRFVETTSLQSLQSKGKVACDRRFSRSSQSGSFVCLGSPFSVVERRIRGMVSDSGISKKKCCNNAS